MITSEIHKSAFVSVENTATPSRQKRRGILLSSFAATALGISGIAAFVSEDDTREEIVADIIIDSPGNKAPTPPPKPVDTGEETASAFARADIPPDYITLYVSTAKSYTPSMPWQVYAGVGDTESKHGKSNAPGVKSGFNFPLHGCCAGPMQFYANKAMVKPGLKTTWEMYGGDYNKDGIVNVYDPGDAIPAAGKYFASLFKSSKGEKQCLNRKLPGDQEVVNALWHYNQSCDYGDKVRAKALEYTKK